MTDLKHMNDDQISSFIIDVSRRRIRDAEMESTADDIASIAFNAGQVSQSIKRIIANPSKQQIEQFKEATTDKRVLYLLESHDVSLGLELKNQYDLGKLDIFDEILNYQHNFVEVEDDLIMDNFIKNSEYFLPPIPDIEDQELKEDIEGNRGLVNYSDLGRSYYENFVNEYLMHRFGDRDIKKLAVYANNHKVASRWARLYELPLDLKVIPYETFFAYVGALISQFGFNSNDLEFEIKNWLTILLEPILMQFDDKIQLKINAKDEIRSLLGHGNIEFRHVFTSTHFEPIHLVQIYANENMLLATSSSDSLANSEARASTIALSNTKLIDRAQKSIKKANESRNKASLSPHVPDPNIQHRYPPQPTYPTYGSYHPTPARMAGPNMAGPNLAMGQSPYMDQSKAVVQAGHGAPAAAYPQGLVNQDYQRQLQQASDSVFECPLVTDEAAIDTSSKEKLNQLLIKSRINPAEYKTDKLNNSDVQVTCYLDNVPIAKALSTNKKKAGQICAQFILNHWNFFHDRFNKFKPGSN